MSNKPLWQAEEVIRAVNGRCLHEQSWDAYGVSIDSRTTAKGDLFIAMQGAIHDGHDQLAAAFAAGASAALVARQPKFAPPGVPLVFVENTLLALQNLGRIARVRAQGKIIAITGSVGKTGTKEMLRLSLGAVGQVYANPDDSAKAWSLPLALARFPPDANYGIFEVGVSRKGELAALSSFIRADIAVITSVDAVHLEYFDSMEALTDAKAEIFQGMTKNGIVILDRDNPYCTRLARAAKKQGIKNILSFSEKSKADAILCDCALTKEGCDIKALIKGREISYSIGASGRHIVKNSLAALLASLSASGKLEECAAALPHYSPSAGCGVIYEIYLPGKGPFRLIDESRSAAPVSVRAAIRVLASAEPMFNERRILVLGDMDELGTTAPELHMGLVPDIKEAAIDLVFCCGDTIRYLYDALPENMRGAYAVNSEELAKCVVQAVRASDILTVKGSESMEMGRIVDVLKALDIQSQRQSVNG